jgi:hypothetical protein
MSDLSRELAELLVRDNAVLFVGAAWRQEREQGPLLQTLAEVLARAIDYRGTERTLPAIARDFELERGRQALIQTVREVVEQMGTSPTPLHELIADVVLPMTKVITTRFDRALEQALERAGKPFVLIIRDTDLPFFDESKVTLIKMQGDITQPDSLVITEDDIEAFLERLPTLSDVVRAFFATKTLIFLGYDLESPQFKRFYKLVTRRLAAYRRPAYAVIGAAPAPPEARYWEREHVHLVVEDPEAFLRELAAVIAALAPAERGQRPLPGGRSEEGAPTAALPARPYKGLAPFTAADTLIFAGRREEARRLTNRILAHRLTVLYGETGVGKTSLLQAGVGPLLAAQGGHLLILTPKPGVAPETAVRAALTDLPGLPATDADTVSDLLRFWQQTHQGPLVLVWDDFETLFTAYDQAEREAALAWWRMLAEDRDRNLRIVLVVREAGLGQLATLEPLWPDILAVRFRLERLNREAARAAIEEPAQRFGFGWAPDLVEQMLDDLDRRGIPPPLLQLLCDRLSTRAMAAEPSGPERLIPAEAYRDLGGVEGILGDYLESVIAALPPAWQETGRRLLAALVALGEMPNHASGLTVDDLLEAVPTDPATAAAVLAALADHHVLRQVPLRAATAAAEAYATTAYELAHESLAARILTWWGEDFWQTQRAYAILRQALAAWHREGRLPAPEDLRLLQGLRDRLRWPAGAPAMLYTAAVTYALDPAAWAPLLEPAQRRRVLLALTAAAEATTRVRACAHLAEDADAETALTLARLATADSDADVRTAAAAAIATGLSQHGQPQALLALIAALRDRHETALAALTLVRDRAPVAARHLPPALARLLQRRVWAVRRRRHQASILAATVAGAQGGFWELGLGFGLVLGLSSAAVFGGIVDTRRLLGLLWTGLAMGGMIGALVGGGAALTRVTLSALQDAEHPLRTWLVATAVAAVMFGLGLMVLNFGAPGPLLPGRMAAAGLLIGGSMAGSTLWPRPWPGLWRAGLTMLCGILGFLVTHSLGLAFVQAELPWLVALGATGGLGLFLGLGRERSHEVLS